jgi:hypothetical protein
VDAARIFCLANHFDPALWFFAQVGAAHEQRFVLFFAPLRLLRGPKAE